MWLLDDWDFGLMGYWNCEILMMLFLDLFFFGLRPNLLLMSVWQERRADVALAVKE